MLRPSPLSPVLALSCVLTLAMAASSATDGALAQSRLTKNQNFESEQADHGSLATPPVMAIVSIKNQNISLYDANGGAMRARVSSGKFDYETPVGIYSVLQKQEEHYSNVYDDASMPFMQRITWSGVSLHEGQLPGYPASHGCVRMPNSFAKQIFPLTKIGMRVIVARDDVAPVELAHPFLLKPPALQGVAAATETAYEPGSDVSVFQADVRNAPEREIELNALKAIAAKKASEAELTKGPAEGTKRITAEKTVERDKLAKVVRAAEKVKRGAEDKATRLARELVRAQDPARLKKWEEAKTKAIAAAAAADVKLAALAAQGTSASEGRERKKADKALRQAQSNKRSSDQNVARAERSLADAASPSNWKKLGEQKAKADAVAAAADAKLVAAKTLLQPAEDALQAAKKESDQTESVKVAAETAAKEALRRTMPVSIFVSLKTQRLYVRQGHEAVLDVPVTIADPDRPIGTHVFTAVDYTQGANDLRWTAVSLARRNSADFAELSDDRYPRRYDSRREPLQTNATIASAALDRLTMPPEILQRVAASVWPGSSLIVSDEGPSKETGNSTDFVVLISGEPQGGIKRRPKPAPIPQYRYNPYYGYGGYGASYAPRPTVRYDRYGRPFRVQQKPVFSWW